MSKLATVARELLDACEADFLSEPDDPAGDEDDDSVAAGIDSQSAVTFGMVRRLRALLPKRETTGDAP